MYPFPQNRQYANCTYPTYSNTDVQNAYDKWKSDEVTTNGAKGFERVQRPNNSSDTVSEGIGYGMILAVYMNDQTLFDDLWQYEQQCLDSHHLMNWQMSSTGSVMGTGSAIDGDEDMAWALLMADKQWTTSPKLGAYLPIAKQQIQYIWAGEIYQGQLPALGDNWGANYNFDNNLNISYFAPAYYRVFAQVDTSDNWAATISTSYSIISANLTAANGNQANGLVPGFSNSVGGQSASGNFSYQYDACRTPFRIGLDWCFNGEARAKSYVTLTSTFFNGIGALHTVDGYALNGTPTGGRPASPFLGPAAVGAMVDPSFSTLVQASYSFLKTNPQQGGEYYAESWTALSLLMLSGNFVDYTHLP
jgi:endo-1,4-beta-D-glucanase Y